MLAVVVSTASFSIEANLSASALFSNEGDAPPRFPTGERMDAICAFMIGRQIKKNGQEASSRKVADVAEVAHRAISQSHVEHETKHTHHRHALADDNQSDASRRAEVLKDACLHSCLVKDSIVGTFSLHLDVDVVLNTPACRPFLVVVSVFRPAVEARPATILKDTGYKKEREMTKEKERKDLLATRPLHNRWLVIRDIEERRRHTECLPVDVGNVEKRVCVSRIDGNVHSARQGRV